MNPQEKKILRRFALFILISILLHIGLGVFFYEFHNPREAQAPVVEAPPQVVFVRPEDILPPPPVVSAQQLELADIAKPKVQKVPKKARFKSQYDSSVKEETVAARVPKKARMEMETSEDDGQKGKTAPAEPPPEKSVSLKDLELHPSDFKDLLKEVKKEDKKEKLSEAKSPAGKEFAAIPSLPRPGLPGEGDYFVHDFLPGVKIGDKTYLDALAYPDVQYFTRLKRVFRMRFNPAPPLRTHLAGNRLVVGKVNVMMAMTLSSSGQLRELFVVKSSGIPGYDAEALRTIRQSSPFSAPPAKILDKEGTLRMTWNFITYL
jgi:TonB family protein